MNRDKSILAIHIDDEFLNIVHLAQTADGLYVRNWGVSPLESGIVKEGLIIDEQMICREIRSFIKINHIKTHKAILSLSCSSVRLMPSELTAQTDQQLRKQVEEEIGKFGLFGGGNIVFDYCIFKQTAQSSNKQTVLEAVTARKTSDACLRVARKASLELVRIEPSVLPIIKLAIKNQPQNSDSISILLVLDTNSGNLSVFKNGLPQLCQNLTIGVKNLSQDENCLAQLTDQIKPVVEFAHSFADTKKIALIVTAACDSEKQKKIVSHLSKSLVDLEIKLVNGTEIVKEFNVQGADLMSAPIFAISSALTFFGITAFNEQISLVSQESIALQRAGKEMSLTAKAIAAVILLSVALLVPLEMKIKDVKAFSSELEVKLKTAIPMAEKISGLKKQTGQLTEKLSVYDANDKYLTCIQWTNVLQKIGNVVPDKVRIIEISTSDTGDFTLTGQALAERYVYKFAQALQDDELIKSVKVEEIEYDKNNAANIVDYKISCKIRLPESNL